MADGSRNGAEIVHPEIYRFFCRTLEKMADGEYIVRFGREVCRVEVEDAPFVIQSIDEEGGGIVVQLNDGTREAFDAVHFWIGDENIPYCRVKEGAFHARFSRPAYYQLASHIVSDNYEKNFFLLVNGERIPIKYEDQPA